MNMDVRINHLISFSKALGMFIPNLKISVAPLPLFVDPSQPLFHSDIKFTHLLSLLIRSTCGHAKKENYVGYSWVNTIEAHVGTQLWLRTSTTVT